MTDVRSESSDEMYPTSPWSSRVHFVVHPLLQMSSAADALPPLFYSISINGKLSSMALIFGYVVSLVLITPMWILSKLITETGVYILLLCTVIFLGRALVRLLVFPGASHRVYGEIETEFARYSVRMLQTASNAFMDVASTLLLVKNNGTSESSQSSVVQRDATALWKRASAYRNRVLRVYVEVLTYLLDENRGGTVSPYGDIGNLEGVSVQAQSDGRVLLNLLQRVLRHVNTLEEQLPFLKTTTFSSTTVAISEEARNTAKMLLDDATELRDILTSFKPQASADDEEQSDYGADDDQENDSRASLRDRLQRQSGSSVDAIKSVAESILPMLDPPPHTSIFGLDVLRGCVLARYRGAQQFWVHRPCGGMIDVLYIPSVTATTDAGVRTRRKAVLYCNPNAGLIEVAAGMSLAGGNVDPDDDGSPDAGWTDFYIENGYDMYLFNYAGFGRSFGSNFCSIPNVNRNVPGALAAVNRIFRSTILGFKPTPDTLRQDAATVGKYIISEIGVESLVIHGESIGGLAASGAARELSTTSTTRDGFSLLVCDRTFCNLEGVAQRLVGKWTGTAIRMLVPLWNTDVAGDFIAIEHPKILAIDAADAIIADASSLKAGVAFAREITNERQTKDICWIVDAPLDYRMADWENVGVVESKFVQPSGIQVRPPMWPADKQITIQEAFHFAACARRIGKVATSEKNGTGTPRTDQSEEEEGIEVTSLILEVERDNTATNNGTADHSGRENQELQRAWKILACCDGLCGAPLGLVVKDGYDCTVSWLCATLTFGGQMLVDAAEKRTPRDATQVDNGEISIITSDFDCRPVGYEKDESEVVVHPIPIPKVVESLKELLSGRSLTIRNVEHELRYCLKTLEYVVARLSSPQAVEESRKNRHVRDASCAFLNLHCGHNNQYSVEEKQKLRALLEEVHSCR